MLQYSFKVIVSEILMLKILENITACEKTIIKKTVLDKSKFNFMNDAATINIFALKTITLDISFICCCCCLINLLRRAF